MDEITAEKKFSSEAYLTNEIRSKLKAGALIKILASVFMGIGLLGALYGLVVFFLDKNLVFLIIFGLVFIIGTIGMFFPKSLLKKSIQMAEKDFADYYSKFDKEKKINLQTQKRSFAFINSNNEMEIHQDCSLVFNIPLNGVQKAELDTSKPKAKDRIGKLPLQSTLIVNMKDGTKYLITLTNTFTTETMYTLESSKSQIKDIYSNNTAIIQKLIDAIYSKGQPSTLSFTPEKKENAPIEPSTKHLKETGSITNPLDKENKQK